MNNERFLVDGLLTLRVVVAAITAIRGKEGTWFECTGALLFFLSVLRKEHHKTKKNKYQRVMWYSIRR